MDTEQVDATPLPSSPISHTLTSKKVNVRLSDTNFLQWKQQILLTIRSHGLETFIDGTSSAPPRVLQEEGVLVPNKAYVTYTQQDSALAQWLLSSISDKILPDLVGFETAHEVWSAVLRIFSSKSTTKVMHLHYKLRGMKKEDRSMKEYITQVKEICDTLKACGKPVDEVEHIATILNGLPPEYDPFVAVITASKDPYSLERATDILLDAEARHKDPMRLPIGINVTQVQNSTPLTLCSTAQPMATPQAPPYQAPLAQIQPPPAPRPYDNRGCGRSNRPRCQLCNKVGHLVARCFLRFDRSFVPSSQPTYRPPRCILSTTPLHLQLQSNLLTIICFPTTSLFSPSICCSYHSYPSTQHQHQ